MRSFISKCCLAAIMFIAYSPCSMAQITDPVTDSGIIVMSSKTDDNISLNARYSEQLSNTDIGNSVAQLKMGILLGDLIKSAISMVDTNKTNVDQREGTVGKLQLELVFQHFKDTNTQNWGVAINGEVISLSIARENPNTGEEVINFNKH